MNIAKSGRFKDAVWFPTEEKPVHVIVGGAGGIGSWLTLLLVRAGFKPSVYDFDTVEEHNIGGQLFGQVHVSKTKVGALDEVVHQFTSEHIDPQAGAYKEDSLTHKYVFSAFDNMKARRDMFMNWLKVNRGNEDAIFIDGRLTFEQLHIFCVTGGDIPAIASYLKYHLFADSEVEDAPCTLKQTSHSAAMIASHMVGFFTNFLSSRAGKPSFIPFSWEYFIPLDMVEVKGPAPVAVLEEAKA